MLQLLCWDKEVASSGASHIVAMELAGDDTILGLGLGLGLEHFLSVDLGIELGLTVFVTSGSYFLRLYTPFSIVGVMSQPYSLG